MALARSGLSLKQLRIAPKAYTLTRSLNNICDDLKSSDHVRSLFRCDDLSQIEVAEIHVIINLNFELREQELDFIVHVDSVL
jgi:hypothetical protein